MYEHPLRFVVSFIDELSYGLARSFHIHLRRNDRSRGSKMPNFIMYEHPLRVQEDSRRG